MNIDSKQSLGSRLDNVTPIKKRDNNFMAKNMKIRKFAKFKSRATSDKRTMKKGTTSGSNDISSAYNSSERNESIGKIILQVYT